MVIIKFVSGKANYNMTQIIALIFLLAFAIAMVLVGISSSKRSKDMDNFLLGGRKIGPWISAFSYGTAYFSAVIFIGYAGNTGWNVGVGGLWIGIGNALLGCLLAWLLLARRTRNITHTLNASTMPEYFSKRYDCRGMKIYAAVIIFLFLVPYCATVYKGLGYLFAQIFPVFGAHGDIYCMLLIAVLTAVYLVAGGYIATSITDFIQGIIMIFGVTVMVIVLVKNPVVGGLSEGFARLRAIDPDLVNPVGGKSWKFLMMNIFLTSFGTWGLPQMVHKYYAIGDEKKIPIAAIVSTAFALIIGVGAYLTGTFGRLYLDNTLPAAGVDNVVPIMLMKALSGTVFNNMVLSIILLLALSASMSTLSSIVLTSSSAIAVDMMSVINPNYDKRKQMLLMRVLCFFFVALSFLFASMKIGFIMQLMSFSWGTVAGCFIGPFIWGMYSKKITRAGAWAGLLSGLVIVGGGTVLLTLTSGFGAAKAASQDMGVYAMAISFVITPLVSVFTKKLPAEHNDMVFKNI